MGLGYTRSRRSWLRKTNRVYQGQRRCTTRAMSPLMRMTLEHTNLGLGSQNVMPQPPPWADEGGARLYWDSLPAFSDIGRPKSYNCIKISYTKIQNKTTTVVMFKVSYTYSPESHLHIQKTLHLHLHDQSAQPTMMDSCWFVGPAVCERSRTSSSVPTQIKTRTKLNA